MSLPFSLFFFLLLSPSTSLLHVRIQTMPSTTRGSRAKVKIFLFGRWPVENRRQKISIPLRWQKIEIFSFRFLGEERTTPRATSRPLDHGYTLYLRDRHLHPLVLPDTKRVGRGVILSRDRRSIVACAVLDQRVNNFQRESCDEIRLSVEFEAVGFLGICRHSCCD